MDIVVCIKQVPDTAATIKLDASGKSISQENITYVMNPFDEYAVEEALQAKEKFGGEVTLVTMGPDRAEEALRTGLAMGADKGVHINDPQLEGTDYFGTARVLATAIKTLPHSIIFCGKVAVDDNAGQVGPQIAELLGIPQVTGATEFEIAEDGASAKAHREVEGATEVLQTPLPAVITAEKDLNQPRYPSLPGIMKAKQKPVQKMTLADLGLNPAEFGAGASKFEVTSMAMPPKREGGRIIEGELPDAVKELVRLLHEEAKVI
ncbi:MAG: electron transfer flavoprotein subunit beta/FixA family protein [Thermoplasmata archaeon]|nr:electron transfer flavoprotein subunit beta/FixA family protein [Thermoplasmata archaeon]